MTNHIAFCINMNLAKCPGNLANKKAASPLDQRKEDMIILEK